MGMEPRTAGGKGELPIAVSTDIANRLHQILPTLSAAEFELLSRYGERQSFKAGDILFKQGDRHISMYVIITGALEIERASALGTAILSTHGPGMFTGEMGTLAGRAAVATGRATADSEMIVISEESLRTLVISEAALSETIGRLGKFGTELAPQFNMTATNINAIIQGKTWKEIT